MRQKTCFLIAAVAITLTLLGGLQSCNDADYITPSGAESRITKVVKDSMANIINRIARAEIDLDTLNANLAKTEAAAEDARQKLKEALTNRINQLEQDLTNSINLQGEDLANQIDQQGKDLSDSIQRQSEELKEFAEVEARQAQLAAIETAKE